MLLLLTKNKYSFMRNDPVEYFPINKVLCINEVNKYVILLVNCSHKYLNFSHN